MYDSGKIEIIIGGRGGQGILLAGYILGLSFIKEGYYVVNSETYSAETRGGFSRSDLIILESDEPDSIKISRADYAIFMYPKQIEKYYSLVGKDADVFIDSTFIASIPNNWNNVFLYPFTRVAGNEIGNKRVANIVALGYFVGKTKLIEIGSLYESIKDVVKKSWRDINLMAANYGYRQAAED